MSEGPFLFVSGRWDNVVSIVDIPAALQADNDGTSAAIVSRVRVTPDIDATGSGVADTPASGQPVSLIVAPDRRLVYVVNHSGRSTPAAAAAFQHGHPGTITVLNVAKALDPANGGTTNAIEEIIATGTAGPVGIALTPDQKHLVVSSAEAEGYEDGGRHVTLIDLETRKVVRQIEQALNDDRDGRFEPSTHPAPHDTFGRYPNANGVAVSSFDSGYILTGNGGTDDVSIISLRGALAGDRRVEVARVPVQTGPFGIATSPDGRLAAVAARESARTGIEGNTISLIDVEHAITASGNAEAARVRVGTDNPDKATRPFAVTFTPDGKKVLASCFRSNTLSLVDVDRALAGEPAETRRVHLSAPGGAPGRPRGLVMLPGGRYAAVIGGAKGAPGSSLVWFVDAEILAPVSSVTGVGNEWYLLDVLPGPRA